MRRLTTVARYNRAKYASSKLYGGLDKNGRTMTATAYTQAEAKAAMRKAGFVPVKMFRT